MSKCKNTLYSKVLEIKEDEKLLDEITGIIIDSRWWDEAEFRLFSLIQRIGKKDVKLGIALTSFLESAVVLESGQFMTPPTACCCENMKLAAKVYAGKRKFHLYIAEED